MTRSVLLVDPDNEHRIRVARSLDVATVRVAGEAADPDEAIRLAAMTRPDAAIVAADLGQEVDAHLVGRLATAHRVPSLLLFRAAEQVAMSRVTAPGVMGVLVTPVDPATLPAAIEVACQRFRDLLALHREGETLRRTLESRKLIERAKGLLMEAEGIPEREAFARLRQKSMDTQRPMDEIARAVILTAGLGGRTRCAEGVAGEVRNQRR